MDNEMEVALEALHVAANAIRKVKGVDDLTVDNDHKSGEIIFNVGTRNFKLALEELE